jgi:hypothetical protein
MRLPNGAADVSPWNNWRMPAIVQDVVPGLEQGPVLVTVEYRVDKEHADAFLLTDYVFPCTTIEGPAFIAQVRSHRGTLLVNFNVSIRC